MRVTQTSEVTQRGSNTMNKMTTIPASDQDTGSTRPLEEWKCELRGFFENSLGEIHDILASLQSCVDAVNEPSTARSELPAATPPSRPTAPPTESAQDDAIDSARSRLENLKRQLSAKLQERPSAVETVSKTGVGN